MQIMEIASGENKKVWELFKKKKQGSELKKKWENYDVGDILSITSQSLKIFICIKMFFG